MSLPFGTPYGPPAPCDVSLNAGNFVVTAGGFVIANLTFTGAATVPVGSTIKDAGNNVWTLVGSAVVAGGAGTFPGLFQSNAVNQTAAAATLTTIGSAVGNWSSVTNPLPSYTGGITMTRDQAKQLGVHLLEAAG